MTISPARSSAPAPSCLPAHQEPWYDKPIQRGADAASFVSRGFGDAWDTISSSPAEIAKMEADLIGMAASAALVEVIGGNSGPACS
jgi:hypothetical protein